MPLSFRFRFIPFVAAVLVAAVGISLGHWQTRRATEKEEIELRMLGRERATPIVLDARSARIDDLEYRQVLVRGKFVPSWPLYVDNRPYNGRAGMYVLMPFKIDGSDMHVLVARGWIARDIADRTKVPTLNTPVETVEIDGVVRRGIGHVLQLGSADRIVPGAIVQNVDVDQVASVSKIPMHSFILEQLSDTHDGLIRDWPRPSTGIEKHRGYAFQWYALAATALIFFFVTGFRRARN